MTPEFYEQVCRICYDALQLEVGHRSGFLEEACAGDESVRREVEAMLSLEGWVEGFLATPALVIVADQAANNLDGTGKIVPENDQSMNSTYSFSSEIQAESLAPGTTLGGRYLIMKELGQGGICSVFLARDQKLHNTPVVVKVLMKIWEQTRHKAWLENKFRGEIAALARIDHPGVVRALDVGELPDGRSYLVMQYVSGESLRSAITQDGMELGRIAKLIRQMGQALAAAHRQGVIHRDLKPENIMLQSVDDEEYVKLIDFGIATIHEMADAAEDRTTEVVGTRSYVAPEQLRGKPVAASDIYALGVIAYEMVTGQRPFKTESIFQHYELQRTGTKIKPRELRPSLPVAAQSIILKALSFSPRDRFTEAKDFTEALANTLTREDRRTLLPSATLVSQRRWLMIIGLIVVAVIGISALPRFNFRNRTETERGRMTSVEGPERYLTYSIERKQDPRLSSPNTTAHGADIFRARDQVRFNIGSTQSGYLYIINQGPTQTDRMPDLNVLFPDLMTQDGSAEIRAGQGMKSDWFVFDQEKGVEKIWLVWSERAVAELEAVKEWTRPKYQGAIRNLIQRESVTCYLDAHSTIKPYEERDEERKETTLKAKGEILVTAITISHH